MKRILIFLAVCLSQLSVSIDMNGGKPYLPVLEEGKEWRYVYYNSNTGEVESLYRHKVVDKVLENGHEVFIIQVDDEDDFRQRYEENSCVWYYSDDDLEYIPMIDFNLEVGDQAGEEFSEVVVWKDTVEVEGVERCIMALQQPGGRMYYWIEGIGSINDFYKTPHTVVIGPYKSYMSECRMGDNVLFDYSRMDEYLASGVRTVGMTEDEEASLYDILGHRISAPVPGQLYIQDGKKHIAR